MSLHTEDSGGTGQVLVFLHGFLESSSMWDYLPLEELTGRRIYVDLPGHGKSETCEVLPPGIDVFARLVMHTLDELCVNSYDLVGHSMGGYVALELKKCDPRAGKVVLLNSNTWSDPEEKKKDRRRVAEIVYQARDLFLREAIPNLFLDPATHRKEIDELIREASHMEPDAIAYAALAMATRRDLTELVIQNPDEFLVIQGEGDRIVPRSLMDNALSGKLSNYIVIRNAGHMAHIEAPGEVMSALGNFLNKKRED